MCVGGKSYLVPIIFFNLFLSLQLVKYGILFRYKLHGGENMRKVFVLVICISILLIGCGSNTEESTKEVTSEEIQQIEEALATISDKIEPFHYEYSTKNGKNVILVYIDDGMLDAYFDPSLMILDHFNNKAYYPESLRN
jgi:hypothetical protein